jgi:hypothetical protein
MYLGQALGRAKRHHGRCAGIGHLLHLGHPVHMARHDMAAHFVTQPQRPFEIDARAPCPGAQRGFRQRLGRDVDAEPVRPLVGHGQAHPVAGDRGADRHVIHRPVAADLGAQIARPVEPPDGSDRGNDACEHDAPFRRRHLARHAVRGKARTGDSARRPWQKAPVKDGRHPWQAVSRFAGAGRRFLFLQGPHGPFFAQLGRLLRRSGAEVRRVGFMPATRCSGPTAPAISAFAIHPRHGRRGSMR